MRMKRSLGVLLSCTVGSIGLLRCPQMHSAPPQADFAATPATGGVPLTVQFTDQSTPGDAPIRYRTWDFGDGSSSTQRNPSHVYEHEGMFTVSLSVETALGSSSETKIDHILADSGEPGPVGETEIFLLPGGVPLEMVWVAPGEFLMGSDADELDRFPDESPQHRVTLTSGFWLGKYEVTKAQWTAVMDTEPWSGRYWTLTDPESPVVYVSWNDAQVFIAALNGLTGHAFRLPSEAEWEYACRAGTTTRFYWGNDPEERVGDDFAWWRYNAYDALERYAHVVGLKLPNAWGLYDMSGNVWEWCADRYGSYENADATDPTGPDSGPRRVRRGGGWHGYGNVCRTARRDQNLPDYRFFNIGFRLAR